MDINYSIVSSNICFPTITTNIAQNEETDALFATTQQVFLIVQSIDIAETVKYRDAGGKGFVMS